MNPNKVKKLIEIFQAEYPEPETELNYSKPFELLVATILSAQSTDKQVNKVTAELFSEYNSPGKFTDMKRDLLEKKINQIGLYRNKSKYIIETARILIDKYGGKVPETREELMELSGVGRKTANVVLACAFAKNAFPVDTHVFRVSHRIGLASSDRVNEVEKQLESVIPEERWIDMHHWLIFHGRNTCKARSPECESCKVKSLCNYYQEGG